MSKQGLCSRSQAARWILQGRVSVDGRPIHDPDLPFHGDVERIALDGQAIAPAQRTYLMLNKPRGLVTSVSDEHGRATVYRCLQNAGLPWLAPVGRLDKASEGLLLFCNDPQWAAAITDPAVGVRKTYHVQIDAIPNDRMLRAIIDGVRVEGTSLQAVSAQLLRTGKRNAWLEIVLDEGRNRHIRNLLAALNLRVLRLVRVAVGPLVLGTLAKGEWRLLDAHEVAALAPPAHAPDG